MGVQLSTKYEDVTFAEVDCDEAEAVSVGSSQTMDAARTTRPCPGEPCRDSWLGLLLQALTNGVKALPCFRFLRAGEEVGILEGAVPSTLEQMIISHRRETPPPAPRGPGRPRGGAAASRDHGR